MTTTKLSPAVKELLDRVQGNPVGARNLYRAQRIAAVSRQLRETVARRGMSVRGLASAMGTSASQAQRLLANSAPANLTLESVFRAADALGIEVEFRVRDAAAGSYYVQRGSFPQIREMTSLGPVAPTAVAPPGLGDTVDDLRAPYAMVGGG